MRLREIIRVDASGKLWISSAAPMLQGVQYKIVDDHQVIHTDWQNTTVTELLWLMPSFASAIGVAGGIPPMNILNRILDRGKEILPTGDGLIWRRFKLTEDDYYKLAETLITDQRLAGKLGG